MKRFSVPALTLLALFLALGCASKPPATPEPEPEPAIDIASLRAETEALKQEAFELGLGDTDEYRAANELYVAGVSAQDSADIPAAAAKYEAARDAFRAAIDSGLALKEKSAKAKALAARDAAESAGGDLVAPDRMAAGAAAFAAAETLSAAGKADEAAASYEAARLAWYNAETKAKALAVKDRIDEYDWSSYDAGNYGLAGEKLAAGDALFPGDPDGSVDAVEEALLRYNLVLDKGFEYQAGERRAVSEKERLAAMDVKADVAVKAGFDDAQSVYDRAVAAFSEGEYEEAARLFEESERQFKAAWEEALAKREAALAAMADMQAAREASAEYAAEADAAAGN
ncbi:MAG: hypothetical protein JXA15_08245 [Spirochaetales bacterium]|nr:hypothetical protein [Spirochaetales bacterium]